MEVRNEFLKKKEESPHNSRRRSGSMEYGVIERNNDKMADVSTDDEPGDDSGKHREWSRSMCRERDRNADRERERERSRDRERVRSKDREGDRNRDREAERSCNRMRNNSRDRERDRSRERDWGRDRGSKSRYHGDSRDRRRRRYSPPSDRRPRHAANDSRRRDKYRRGTRSRSRSPIVSRANIHRSNGIRNSGRGRSLTTGMASMSSTSTNNEIKLPSFKPKVVLCEKKEDKDITKLWASTTFAQDDGGKIATKFKRLMGLKDGDSGGDLVNTGREVQKKQAELFSNMEQQYEVARTTTHTMRGMGLGFAK